MRPSRVRRVCAVACGRAAASSSADADECRASFVDMRNVRVESTRTRLALAREDGETIAHGVSDLENGAFYAVIGARGGDDDANGTSWRRLELASFHAATGARTSSQALYDEAQALEMHVVSGSSDVVVGLAHAIERGGVVGAFASGECVAADGDENAQLMPCECVGDVPDGVLAFEMSPDGEVCAALTSTGAVVVMTKDLYPLGERAPDAARSDGFTRGAISWRGDGEFFACCATDASGDTTLRVMRREDVSVESVGERGSTLSASASVSALSSGGALGVVPLAWQPRGALIATAARVDGEKSDRVVFYERNGLRRGEFALPGDAHVDALAWSADSQCLGVVVAYSSANDDVIAQRAVQIWTRSNMHWYLKYETRYGAEEGVVRIEWDVERGETLRCFTASGILERKQLYWDTTTSDVGTCAVIDGDVLMLTPMFRTPVPPPLCAARAIFDAPIVAAAFSPFSGDVERVAALLSTGALALVSSVASTDWERTADEFADSERAATWARWNACEIPGETLVVDDLALAVKSGAALEHIAWVDDDHVAVALSYDEYSRCEIWIVPVRADAHGALSKRMVPEAVGAMTTSGRGAACAIARDSSHVYVVRSSDAVANGGETLANAVRVVANTSAESYSSGDKIIVARGGVVSSLLAERREPTLVTLDARGHLKIGDILIASAVTSFALHMSPADGCAVTTANASAAVMAPLKTAVDEGEPTTRVAYVTRAHQLFVAEVDDVIANGARARTHAVVAEDDAHIGNWLSERSAADGARMGELTFDDLHLRMRRAMRPDAAKTDADATKRHVEDGALIVACAPGSTSVVLQMPRGNLETVAPKALVLPAVACALRAGRYADAYALAAKQRVDLNLIVDYGWPNFINAAEAFVRDVNSADAIMELLEALDDVDVTAKGGIYEELARLYPPRVTTPTDAGDDDCSTTQSKTDKVCVAIRRAIEAHDAGGRWELAALTSYAAGDAPDLSAALRRVAVLREIELAHATQNTLNVDTRRGARDESVNAAVALKHLLFLVGGPTLYAAALGTYDLSLAYLVAQHAHMDPGEYVPELQHLQSMREHERRAEVAKRLRRVDEAITEYLLDGDVERAGELAKDHKLFPHALAEAARLNLKDARTALLLKHADALSVAMRFDDAAVARLAAGDVSGALDEYRSATSWRQAMTLAARLNVAPKAMRDIAEELCESLVMTDPLSAARVASTHLKDVDRAVDCFILAKAWRDATSCAYADNRGDLMQTTIAPAAAGAAEEHIETFKENKARSEKYVARLKDLRRRRREASSLGAADWSALGGRPKSGQYDGGDGDDFDDGASDAPSLASDMSAYTDRTGLTSAASGTSSAASTVGGRKSKKKKDKKGKKNRSGLRAGSPTEERDLAMHVLSLAPMAKTLEEVGELLELLVLLGHEGDARTLQRVASEAVDAHDASKIDAQTSLDELMAIAKDKGEKLDAFTPTDAGAGGVEWKWTALKSIKKTVQSTVAER